MPCKQTDKLAVVAASSRIVYVFEIPKARSLAVFVSRFIQLVGISVGESGRKLAHFCVGVESLLVRSIGKISVARWVSILAHPFVMIVLMVVTAGARLDAPSDVILAIGEVSLFVIIPLAVLSMWQVRRGAWANVDASRPRDRVVLYTVGIGGVIALLTYLAVFRPESYLLRGTVVVLPVLAVCAVMTRWAKVSLHMVSASLTASALMLQGSVVGWLVASILPVLAWSRFALGRHTPLELALGMLLGVLAGVVIHLV